MKYKTGDTVWYIDYTPRIQKSVIRGVYGSIEKPYYCFEDKPPQFYLYEHQIFLTKEALLSGIDPPNPIVIGYTCQGIWDNKILIAKCFEGDYYNANTYPTIEDLLKAKQW